MHYQITIRKGIPGDLTEMQKLFVDTIYEVCSADYDPLQINVWTSSVADKKRWSEMMLSQFVLVALIENKIVGFASLENSSYIDFLYVHKDLQRLGIAHKLYTEIEAEAKQQGQAELTSDVSKTAKPFFEKAGFEVVEQQTVVRQKVEISNFRMKKKLNKI